MMSAEQPSYFDNSVEANKLAREALSWLGTPFSEYNQEGVEEARKLDPTLEIKDGGIDCIGLVQEIFYRIGATDKFIFARTSADYQAHASGDKILDWLRGKADDPQSKRLAETFIELEIPDEVTDSNAATPRDFFKPGDILLLQHGSLFHMPVIYDNDLHFVNSIPRRGVIEGTIQDSTYSKHLVAVFRLKPKEKT